ncbi:MAG: sigma-70 family RNA polymerase sigma factor, partial [Acidimicrobiales bacterium]
MATISERPVRDELEAVFETHRRELHVHCYRMTGSLADAEDLTQDVFVRAWRNVDRFDRRASLRTWLYRIATNACIDFLRSHQRRAHPTASIEETLEREGWVDPYPDRADPAEHIAAGETTDLYFMAALGHLPVRQRAALIARDLLEFDARHAATVLDCTPTAVNSLLQRAHHRLRELGVNPSHTPVSTSDDEVVRTYIDAHQTRRRRHHRLLARRRRVDHHAARATMPRRRSGRPVLPSDSRSRWTRGVGTDLRPGERHPRRHQLRAQAWRRLGPAALDRPDHYAERHNQR